MSRFYTKAKKYVIRPSCKKKVIEYIEKNFQGSKRAGAFRKVIDNIPTTYKRWLYYFDFEILEEILMEEGYEEIVEEK